MNEHFFNAHIAGKKFRFYWILRSTIKPILKIVKFVAVPLNLKWHLRMGNLFNSRCGILNNKLDIFLVLCASNNYVNGIKF